MNTSNISRTCQHRLRVLRHRHARTDGLQISSWHLLVALICGAMAVGCGGGGEASKCVEGQSVACACPGGGSGAQTCNARGAFESCSCPSAAPSPLAQTPNTARGAGIGSAGSAGSATCKLEELRCERFSNQSKAGWALHELVHAARKARRYAEAICLAQASTKSGDAALVGASHFEMAKSWEGLGCIVNAMTAIGESEQVRPRGRGGWKETCDYCLELGAACPRCLNVEPTLRACPTGSAAVSLLAKVLKTGRKVTVQTCAPGRFPDAGWAFVAWNGERADLAGSSAGNEGNEYAARLEHVIVSDANALVARSGRAATWHERNDDEEVTWKKLEAVDFDGDGIDEVVEGTEYTRRGFVVDYVNVHKLLGAKLVKVFELQTGTDDSAMEFEQGSTSCSATWKVESDEKLRVSLLVTGESATGPDSKNCVRGTKRYRMRKGKLVAE